jgi:hypothetical protein
MSLGAIAKQDLDALICGVGTRDLENAWRHALSSSSDLVVVPPQRCLRMVQPRHLPLDSYRSDGDLLQTAREATGWSCP